MIQLKRKQTYAIAAIVIGIMLAFIVPAVNRIGKPKFEGKTADEWLDYAESEFVRRGDYDSSPGGLFHDLVIKELTVALASFGEDTQKDLIRDYLYFKYPTGFKTNVYSLNDRLPPSVRLKRFSHPVKRWNIIGRVLPEIKPSWAEVEPFIGPLKASGDRAQIFHLTLLLGCIGEGATNAVPFLVGSRTNGFSFQALRSLKDLKASSAPAVPALLEDVHSDRSSIDHLRILAAIGPGAAQAIPDLEALLENPPNGLDSQYIAATMLSIDPDHQEALNHLNDYYMNKAWVRKLSRSDWNASVSKLDRNDWKYLDLITAPNKPVAEMILKYIDKSESILEAAAHIHKFDPDIGLPILYKKLHDLDTTTDREVIRYRARLSFSAIWVILNSDPYDQTALKFLNKYLPREPVSLLYLIDRHCYSDSPGVLDALEKLEKNTANKQVLDSIQITRRHIELNDKLRELKKNTH